MNPMLCSVSPPNATRLLARMLDEPALPEKVRKLSPRALGELIRRIGLEDAGELVALATTEQLVGVFDEDLWHSEQPGEEETFDAERFALWLEVLLEAGETFAADRLAELPEDFLTLALYQQLWVLDVDELAATMQQGDRDEAEQLDKALSDWAYEELDHYQLMARRPHGWDATLSAVLALDREHGALLRRVLDRCVQLSADCIAESGGLYQVLTAGEMLASDAAAEREARRTAAGYVPAATAASFLKLAASETGDGSAERDPVTRAHFRDRGLEPALARRPKGGGRRRRTGSVTASGSAAGAAPRLPAEPDPRDAASWALGTLRALGEAEAALYDERREELAYLANVLVAAATLGQRRVRPVEAIRAAAAVVALGLEGVLREQPRGATPSELLETCCLDTLFRRGWAKLHRQARHNGRACAYNDLEVLCAEPSLGAASESRGCLRAPPTRPRRAR